MSVIGAAAGFAPLGAVFDDPVSQSPFEADVVAGFFGLDPFMSEDLFALGLKFAVQGRVLDRSLPLEVILSSYSTYRIQSRSNFVTEFMNTLI